MGYNPSFRRVSIHALTRRATNFLILQHLNSLFQSTPSRGGRHIPMYGGPSTFEFQSTPSRGGRHIPMYGGPSTFEFQSTPSRGGRQAVGNDAFFQFLFQSTPSRGGRPASVPLKLFGLIVSIHALTRRATGGLQHNRGQPERFNPRPHAEGDSIAHS